MAEIKRPTSKLERERERMMEEKGDDLGFKMHREPRTGTNWAILGIILLAALSVPLVYAIVGILSSIASTTTGLVVSMIFLTFLIGAAVAAVATVMKRGLGSSGAISNEQGEVSMTRRADDLMSRNIVNCGNLDSIAECAKILYRHNVGAVTVINAQDQCVGIVTDRDIVCAGVAQGLDLQATPVTAIMESDVKFVEPHHSLFDVLSKMNESGIRRVPVLDKERRCIGMISLDDLIARGAVSIDDVQPIFAKQLSEPNPRHGVTVSEEAAA